MQNVSGARLGIPTSPLAVYLCLDKQLQVEGWAGQMYIPRLLKRICAKAVHVFFSSFGDSCSTFTK